MLNSSVARKLFMALSGLFLIIFLTQHLLINLTSLISPDLLIQFLISWEQTQLFNIFCNINTGRVFSFCYGFCFRNKKQ